MGNKWSFIFHADANRRRRNRLFDKAQILTGNDSRRPPLTPYIECTGLTVRYRNNVEALSHVSFRIGRGTIALLGVNGAGKTTLMQVLATLRLPDAGDVSLNGQDALSSDGRDTVRKSLGYLPQQFTLLRSATVFDNVRYAAWAHGIPVGDVDTAAERAIDMVGLSGESQRRARSLSGGQRHRLALACAVAHRPSILLLDEPMAGLDPLHRMRIRDGLQQIAASATVLFSTHVIDESVTHANHLLILSAGRLVFDGTPDRLSNAPGSVPTVTDIERFLGDHL